MIGKRKESGHYGLPGGWLELGEEWEDCASRELFEETGLKKPIDFFHHIHTLNCKKLEYNFHSISCIMMNEVQDNEIDDIYNKEPNKCYGWFWTNVENMRKNIDKLFHPLQDFLNKFNFEYNFKSSSVLYKSGFFNPTLQIILENYQGIMDIILPTLGKERQRTYSPFLPICPNTGKVLEIPVLEILKDKSKIIFDNNGEKLEISILDGNCKLQWKVDWAMRWYALDIDFEMYGKDLIESAILSSRIVKLIGKTNPSGFAYELFLDEKGEKILKSKGNGITIDQWLEYASPESLSLYMYQNPKRAKKLYKEIVPKTVDEYLELIEKAKKQKELQLLMNPVWHVHNGKIPKEDTIMSFSMLLNLVETSNADSKELLWKFVKKYKKDISEKDHPIFDNLIGYAIKYFNDVIKIQKKYKKANDSEKKALEALIKTLDECNDKMLPEDIQTLIYSTVKDNGYSENLRDWFKLIYEVVFGDENGPRMGFFISFFGVNETKELIKEKIK